MASAIKCAASVIASLNGLARPARQVCVSHLIFVNQVISLDLKLSNYGPYCANESITVTWNIPESLASNT